MVSIGMSGYGGIGAVKQKYDDYFYREATGPGHMRWTPDPGYVGEYRDYQSVKNNPTRQQIEWELESSLALLRAKEEAALKEGNLNRAHELQLQRERLEQEREALKYSKESDASMAYAGARNDIVGRAAGMVRERDRDSARGEFAPSQSFYQQLMADGGMSDADYNRQVSQRGEAADAVALSAAHQVASSTAQRGLSGNPMATAALSLGGRFAASRARGEAATGLTQERIRNRMAGAQGHAAGAGQLADLWMTPTQEGALGTLGMVERAQLPEYGNGGGSFGAGRFPVGADAAGLGTYGGGRLPIDQKRRRPAPGGGNGDGYGRLRERRRLGPDYLGG